MKSVEKHRIEKIFRAKFTILFLISMFSFSALQAKNPVNTEPAVSNNPIKIEQVEYCWHSVKTSVSSVSGENIQGKWNNTRLMKNLPGKTPGNALWIRFRLPCKKYSSPALMISGVHQVFEVFFNKKSIYRFGSVDASGRMAFPGYRWHHIIPLPENYQEQRVYFKIYSVSNLIGFTSAVINTESRHISSIIKNDIVKLLIGVFMIYFGLLSIVYIFARKLKGFDFIAKSKSIFLNFSFFSICMGIAIIADTMLKELVFDAPLMWLYIRLGAIYLFTAGILNFFHHVSDSKHRIVLKIFFYIFLVYAFIAIFLSLLNVVPAMSTTLPYNILLIIATLAVLTNFFTSSIRRDINGKVFIFGTVILMMAGIRDALVDIGFIPGHEFIQHWGMFIFIVSLGFVMANRIIGLNQKFYSYQNELEIARDIQMSIMSGELPVLSGLDIGTAYIPMTEVGGDFYDFAHPESHKVGIFISDVSGHGIPAALLSSMIKITFENISHLAENPSGLITEMNNRLYLNLKDNFVTANYIFIDLEKMKLYNSNAGHPSMLIWRKIDKKIHEYNPRGSLLGQFENLVFKTMEIDITPGDKIILYTDGVTETHDRNNRLFGDEAFNRFIMRNAYLDATRFCVKLISTLRKWGNKESFDDDITLLVIDVV